MTIDILFCSIPSNELYLPPAAAATLKGHLTTQNFTSKCIDLNLLMYNLVPNQFNQLNAYFSNEHSKVTPDIEPYWDNVLQTWISTIQQEKFKWLGISVFTEDSRRAAIDICQRLKDRDFKIVLGGMGVTTEFGSMLLDQGYIDTFIIGEGEHALAHLLNGNTDYPGINSPGVQISDLDSLGFADYSDYNLDQYTGFYNEPVVQITGSRGCVRNCTFCDISVHWPKYKFRSGKSISSEIIQTYEQKGIKNFYFTDSLINGSMSAYMSMCEELAKYNQSHNSNITWGGQYIVRPEKGLPVDYYKLTAASGAFNLAIGVETGSDAVRAHMRKKFSNEDLDLTMENFARHRITCSFLMIVGYPTETTEDFHKTLNMFKQYQRYAAQGIILGVTLGGTLTPLKNTPLSNMFKDDLHYQDKTVPISWIIQQNSELDYRVRVARRLQAELVLNYLGYNLISSDRDFNVLARQLNVLTE
jgi:radical SAM superfamily enzyme YgiQ (UPF0313 family)